MQGFRGFRVQWFLGFKDFRGSGVLDFKDLTGLVIWV